MSPLRFFSLRTLATGKIAHAVVPLLMNYQNLSSHIKEQRLAACIALGDDQSKDVPTTTAQLT